MAEQSQEGTDARRGDTPIVTSPCISPERPETLTHPLSPRWLERPDGYRHFESAYFVGHGRDTFERCAEELLHWEVKVRSGFDIEVDVDAVLVGSADMVSRAAGAESTADVDARADGVGSGLPPRVEPGQEPTIRVRLGPFRLHEPSRVIDVFEAEDRCGFTYGTKPGHPERSHSSSSAPPIIGSSSS